MLNLEEKLTLEIDKGNSKNYYPLTEKTIHNLSNRMVDTSLMFSKDDDEEIIEDSGRVVTRQIFTASFLTIKRHKFVSAEDAARMGNKRLKTKTKPAGAFFKFYNKTHFDFSKYGIYQEGQKANYNDNCLYLALKYGGMSAKKLEHFELTAHTRSIPRTMLEKICQDLEISIHLTSYYGKDSRENSNKLTAKYTVYNKEEYDTGRPHNKTKGKSSEEESENVKYDGAGEIYKIGLIHDHYFLIDTAEVTEYALTHYEEVKHVKDCHRIRAG